MASLDSLEVLPMAPQQMRRVGAKKIKPEKYEKVRGLLHVYRAKTQLNGEARPTGLESSAPISSTIGLDHPTLTEASRTSPREPSLTSHGSSYTGVWSADSGMEQRDSGKKSLDPVCRAKKNLMRCLGGCDRDCRARKVKCYLSHYAIEDLLDGKHKPQDIDNVQWALKADSDPHDHHEILDTQVEDMPTPTPTLTPGAEDVLNQADRAFDIESPPDFYYTGRIQDSTASLLDPEPSDSQGVGTDDNSYTTQRYEEMLLVGERVDNPASSSKHYECSFVLGCAFTCQDPSSLLDHYSAYHTLLKRLPGSPLRLVCPCCDTFYGFPNERCSNYACPYPLLPPKERVYGELDHQILDLFSRGAGSMHSGGYGTDQGGNLQQSAGYGWGPSLISPNQFNDLRFNGGFGGGGNMNNDNWGWGYRAPRFQLGIPTYTVSLSSCRRSIGELIRVRKYSFVFALATLLSLLISLQNHVWVMILSSHVLTLLTSQNASVIGLAVMSFAFCVHRFLQFALSSADGNIPVLQHPLVAHYGLDGIFHGPCYQTLPPYSDLLSDHKLDLTQTSLTELS